MPVTLTINASKPADKEWFPQSSPENLALSRAINIWTKSQPGFISQVTENIDANTRKTTIVWDSVENYANWFSERNKMPEQIARLSYNRLNGITSVNNEFIS